ncbi:TPA: polysaccharide biosynthesis C-terminal domain-containing protein [Streptococcus suis]
MNRYRYLLRNIGLLTLSSFASRLLSFFLVPLYTNLLSTTEFGTYDLYNTTIGVLLPILTLNIQEAVMRFSIDSKYDRKSIVTVAVRYLIFSNFIVILGLLVNNVFAFSLIAKQHAIFFFLMFLAQSLSGMITMYVRGIDKIFDLSVSSIIVSVISICLNVSFLAFLHWGLVGYFIANIIGPIIQSLYLIIKVNVVGDIQLRQAYLTEKNEMVKYSKPLIANSIAWWVNNAADRYIIVFFCGLAENGVYSVASKIPSILNIFQTIFNQAWTLSAVKDFDPEDKNGFFTNTYKAYNCMMVVVCSGIIVFDKILASFLYAKDFYVAWKYVPWLTIAIVFGAMSGYIGGFFAAVKDSKIFAKSTVYGAITNVILNLILTPIMGTLGAAIATAVSYFEVWIFRYLHSRRYIKIKVNVFRDLIAYVLLVCQSSILLIDMKNLYIYFLEFVMFTFIILLYVKDIVLLLNKDRNSLKTKKEVK